MAIFQSLRCHFCGTRSKHSKGAISFQCLACEAHNFFDRAGNVADVPLSEVTSSTYAVQTFSNSPRAEPSHQRIQPFCDVCLRNQRIYLEHISQYLPEEDDPRYEEYERNFPEYKKRLEQKYPQICVSCAPKAQTKIHDADLYGQTQTFAQNMENTRQLRQKGKSVKGMRDTAFKRVMRGVLGCARAAAMASLAIQIVWHIYGIFAELSRPANYAIIVDDMNTWTPVDYAASRQICLEHLPLLGFCPLCLYTFRNIVWGSLLVSASLLWYNPALRYYWHDTYLIESTSGKRGYFRTQAAMLMVRTGAWYMLSNVAFTASLTPQRTSALHSVVVIFLITAQWLGALDIGYAKLQVRTKIMPLPDEQDAFAEFAGPAGVNQQPQASSVQPIKLFEREDRPFPIQSLAPTRSTFRFDSRLGHPSPPESPLCSADQDAMDIDWYPPGANKNTRATQPIQYGNNNVIRSNMDSTIRSADGWSAMRGEAFRIEDQIRSSNEQYGLQAQQSATSQFRPISSGYASPFGGTIPPAPMSINRRLRNPPPVTQTRQKDSVMQPRFMASMREGIEDAQTFRTAKQPAYGQISMHGLCLEDDTRSPDKKPLRTELNDVTIRPAQWTWQKDLDDQWTGLEDLLGGNSFRIDDNISTGSRTACDPSTFRTLSRRTLLISALLFASVGLAFFLSQFGRTYVVETLIRWKRVAFPFA